MPALNKLFQSPQKMRPVYVRIRQPVIVVDDSRDDRFLLSRFLGKIVPENTPIICLCSGRELLAYLDNLEKQDMSPEEFQKEMPAMIFLDLFMWGMNGIKTLQELRRRPVWADVPVTLTTSSRDDISIHQAEEAGANAFLPKPFTKIDVMKALTRKNNYSASIIF